jgi:hypothetical protein
MDSLNAALELSRLRLLGWTGGNGAMTGAKPRHFLVSFFFSGPWSRLAVIVLYSTREEMDAEK